MNIVYGVSGVGYGHATRAKEIISYLKKKSHRVLILGYDQSSSFLEEHFKILKINGMRISFEKGLVNNRKTLAINIKNFSKNFFNLKVYKEIRKFKPDIFITDMEPLTTFFSAVFNKPLITIDNEHFLTNYEHEKNKRFFDDQDIASAIVKIFSIGAVYNIVLTPFKKRPKNNHTFSCSPVIRSEVKKLNSKNEDFILVYLSVKNDRVLDILKKMNYKFCIYGYNINKKTGNLIFKTGETFLHDLEKSRGIIASAGFSLISEALYLKKPYLALPIAGHFEQMQNAVYLKKSGFGTYSKNLNENEVLDFLKNLLVYRKKLSNYHFNDEEIFIILENVLDKIRSENLKKDLILQK